MQATLDLQIVFNLALSAAVAGIGWFFNTMWNNHQGLYKDMKCIEVELPEKYVKKDEFHQTMLEIKSMLVRIDDKLDGKADKR